MDPVKLRFYTEKHEKENRLLKLQEEFVVTTPGKFVTGKFYARHDAVSEADVREEYVKFVARRVALKPTDIYAYRPPAVNMVYGWFIQPLIPKTADPRLYFGKRQCDFIHNELQLRKLHKGIPVEKFTGVPFKT